MPERASAGRVGQLGGQGAAGAHEDERALSEGRPREQSRAGDGESDVDVVQQQEGREGPELVEGKEQEPETQEVAAGAGRAEQHRCEDERAHRNEHRGCDDEDDEQQGGTGHRGEEVGNLAEIGKRSDVKADVHELKEYEEGLGERRGDFGELVGCGEERRARGLRVQGLRGRRIFFESRSWLGLGAAVGRCGGGCIADAFNGSYEAVATAGEGFDEAGAGGCVAEGFAEAVDGGVDAVLGVDESAVGPKGAGDLVAGEQLAGVLEEQAEELEGLDVETDADALAAELAGGGVYVEDAEAIAGWP